MMSRWQYNLLFFITAGGAVFLFFADSLGIHVGGLALTGYSAITSFVLFERAINTTRRGKKDKDKEDDSK